MEKEYFNSKNWTAKNYKTASELENFLNSVKPSLIGKNISKIMVMGHIFNAAENYYDHIGDKWFMYDNDNNYVEIKEEEVEFLKNDTNEKVLLQLDEPVVLFFDNDRLEIEYTEGSLAQVGFNSLTLEEISAIEGCYAWKDVSHYFSKNIIGRKLVDIVINKTNELYFPCFSFERKDVEDMYEEIIFIFDNDIRLEINMYLADYMSVAEVKEKK